MAYCRQNALRSPFPLPVVYLAGKVGGDKWTVARDFSDRVSFISSDGGDHSEHGYGIAAFSFEMLDSLGFGQEMIIENSISQLLASDYLIAYLDKPDSFGSIAEIAYASALGKRCVVIVLESPFPDEQMESPMYDAYWFISCFPHVELYVVYSLEEAKLVADILTQHPAVVTMACCPFDTFFESPLERKLFEAIVSKSQGFSQDLQRPVLHLLYDHKLLTIQPQYQIKLSKNYRLDFLLTSRSKQLALEVDGHDYHERTKEQAKRDKERDRALVAAGFTVMRFTGSEIYHNADKAAREVLDFVVKGGA